MNNQTGEFEAIMDANWITNMRTGAVAAHSIKLFAKKDFKTMGIIGLGNTAASTMLVLTDIFKDKPLKIKLFKYKGQEVVFAERFSACENLKFEYVETVREVIEDSDVVISAATYFEDDICDDDAFKEGVLVVPIHTRGFSNCDLFFDKVYADDTGHVCHFKNYDKFKYFAEVGDVVRGEKPGRETDRERILAYNIGISLHDIMFGRYIYDMLKDNTEITEIDF